MKNNLINKVLEDIGVSDNAVIEVKSVTTRINKLSICKVDALANMSNKSRTIMVAELVEIGLSQLLPKLTGQVLTNYNNLLDKEVSREFPEWTSTNSAGEVRQLSADEIFELSNHIEFEEEERKAKKEAEFFADLAEEEEKKGISK